MSFAGATLRPSGAKSVSRICARKSGGATSQIAISHSRRNGRCFRPFIAPHSSLVVQPHAAAATFSPIESTASFTARSESRSRRATRSLRP